MQEPLLYCKELAYSAGCEQVTNRRYSLQETMRSSAVTISTWMGTWRVENYSESFS